MQKASVKSTRFASPVAIEGFIPAKDKSYKAICAGVGAYFNAPQNFEFFNAFSELPPDADKATFDRYYNACNGICNKIIPYFKSSTGLADSEDRKARQQITFNLASALEARKLVWAFYQQKHEALLAIEKRSAPSVDIQIAKQSFEAACNAWDAASEAFEQACNHAKKYYLESEQSKTPTDVMTTKDNLKLILQAAKGGVSVELEIYRIAKQKEQYGAIRDELAKLQKASTVAATEELEFSQIASKLGLINASINISQACEDAGSAPALLEARRKALGNLVMAIEHHLTALNLADDKLITSTRTNLFSVLTATKGLIDADSRVPGWSPASAMLNTSAIQINRVETLIATALAESQATAHPCSRITLKQVAARGSISAVAAASRPARARSIAAGAGRISLATHLSELTPGEVGEMSLSEASIAESMVFPGSPTSNTVASSFSPAEYGFSLGGKRLTRTGSEVGAIDSPVPGKRRIKIVGASNLTGFRNPQVKPGVIVLKRTTKPSVDGALRRQAASRSATPPRSPKKPADNISPLAVAAGVGIGMRQKSSEALAAAGVEFTIDNPVMPRANSAGSLRRASQVSLGGQIRVGALRSRSASVNPGTVNPLHNVARDNITQVANVYKTTTEKRRAALIGGQQIQRAVYACCLIAAVLAIAGVSTGLAAAAGAFRTTDDYASGTAVVNNATASATALATVTASLLATISSSILPSASSSFTGSRSGSWSASALPAITNSVSPSPVAVSPANSVSPSNSGTITATVSRSGSSSLTSSQSLAPSPTASITLSVSGSGSESPTATSSKSSGASSSSTPTVTLTVTPTVSGSYSMTVVASTSPAVTTTSTFTVTPSLSATNSMTFSASITATGSVWVTATESPTNPFSSSVSPSVSPSVSSTVTITPSYAGSGLASSTESPAVSPTPSYSMTQSNSMSPSISLSSVVTASTSPSPPSTVAPNSCITQLTLLGNVGDIINVKRSNFTSDATVTQVFFGLDGVNLPAILHWGTLDRSGNFTATSDPAGKFYFKITNNNAQASLPIVCYDASNNVLCSSSLNVVTMPSARLLQEKSTWPQAKRYAFSLLGWKEPEPLVVVVNSEQEIANLSREIEQLNLQLAIKQKQIPRVRMNLRGALLDQIQAIQGQIKLREDRLQELTRTPHHELESNYSFIR